MTYNVQNNDGRYITEINILNGELIPLKRILHENSIIKWVLNYIDKYMKRPLSEDDMIYYFIKAENIKNMMNIEKNRITRYLIKVFGKDVVYRWEFNSNSHVFTIITNTAITLPEHILARPKKLTIDPYQESIAELYRDEWDTSQYTEDKKTTFIRTCTIQLTEACNLCCSYCYQINKKQNKMDFETAKKFVDIILESNENTPYLHSDVLYGLVFDFVGGESFVEVDLMDKICEYIIDRILQLRHRWLFTTRLGTSSNGTLHMTEKVQKFLDKWEVMFSTAITVDGCKELHDMCRLFPDGSGSYELAIAAVKDLENRGQGMASKVTLSPDNLGYFYKAITNMVELGYTDIHSNPIFEEGWTIEDAKKYFIELKKIATYFLDNDLYHKVDFIVWKEDGIGKIPDDDNANWCGGDGSMIAVNPSGNIYPCLRYMETSIGDNVEPYIVGDVDNGLLYTEKQKIMADELTKITRKSQSTKECIDCPVNQGCSWCTAYNYQRFGTPNKRATFICWMHKAEVLANAYYWNNVRMKYPSIKFPFLIHLPKDDALNIITEDEWTSLKDLEQRAIEVVETHQNIKITRSEI